MLKNYLITIFRQIRNNKTFSIINILGLALGMAACLFITQYVNFHRSFDHYHKNSDRIFRVESETFVNGEEVGRSITSSAMISSTLKKESPLVKEVVRFYPYNYANNTVIYDSEKGRILLEQAGVYGGERAFFEVFDVPFKSGGFQTFDEPNKAIMTLSTATKYFESPAEAIGKTIALTNNDKTVDYELVGVIEDFPVNSHIQFELLISFPSIDNYTQARTNWAYQSMITYLVLDDPSKTAEITENINALYSENSKALIEKKGFQFDFYLQALSDIHLNTVNVHDFTRGVDKRTIIAMSLIALVILIIAWINYMNLSLVRTVERLKEIGIRKCMGSNLKQVTQLFILEALVMNSIAFGLAISINQFAAPYLRELSGLPLSAVESIRPFLLLSMLILAGTLIIGLYPYALLKTINISNVLVGKRGKAGNSKMRKGLVFAQFVTTALLIASTLTIYFQNDYMRKADLKIDIENVLVIQSPPGDIDSEEREDVKRFNTLKTELLKHPNISQVTNAGEIPGEDITWGAGLYRKNESPEQAVATSLISMDLEFPDFFEIDLIAGRKLRKGDDPWSKGDVLINERLAEMLGFSNPKDAVGEELDGFYSRNPLKIRGVLENHHHTSLHNDFAPIAYILSSWTEYYFIKYQLDETKPASLLEQTERLVSTVQAEWNGIFTDYQMNYFFLDQSFDLQYKQDIRFGKIFGGFTVLAIVIACLGLFGLTSFAIQQRKKEIGIRKVLGAGFNSLMQLLSKEYLVLVSLACVVSLPLAYLLMSRWLEKYPFSINLGWWFYLAPIVIILGLSVLSILFKIIGTVRTNPVESLRYE